MFVIGEVTVDERIAHEQFACDLVQCKGACCTLPGGRGAPVRDDEVLHLNNAAPAAQKYLSERHRRIIASKGAIEGVPGSYATTCVDNRDCVFVFDEDGVARCSIEKAYFNGETTWRKPVSCHLFPIRRSVWPNTVIRYEEIQECRPGKALGRTDKVPLYEFLRDSLIRAFGAAWYETFRDECKRRNNLANES